MQENMRIAWVSTLLGRDETQKMPLHCHEGLNHKEASRYDVSKFFRFFDTLPLVRIWQLIYRMMFMQTLLLCLLFGNPPRPPTADVIFVCSPT